MTKIIKHSNIKAIEENRLPIVAVDFDGTLVEYKDYPEIGDPIPGMKEELEKLRASGWIICIWTVRDTNERVRKHLEKHGIPFDFINDNPVGPEDQSRKIYADVYIDDRAVTFNGNPKGLAERVLAFKAWHE